MKEATYFIAIAWENIQKEIRFGNSVISKSPLEWLKEMRERDNPLFTKVTLLWWKQLTEEEEKVASGVGQAF